jgi:lipopolysaccharide export system protein LptA
MAIHYGRSTKATGNGVYYFNGTIVLGEAQSLILLDGREVRGDWLLVNMRQGHIAWVDSDAIPFPRIVPATSVLIASRVDP